MSICAVISVGHFWIILNGPAVICAILVWFAVRPGIWNVFPKVPILLHVRNLLSLAQRGDALEVAVASAVEPHILYLVSEELQLDHLRAHSLGLCDHGPDAAAECIVHYSHITIF